MNIPAESTLIRTPSRKKAPPGEPEPRTEELLIGHLLSILQSASADPEQGIPNSLKGLENVESLLSLIWEIRKMIEALSKGDLDHACQAKGFVAGSLKAFQANLRHLTWQAQRIAEGEYNHRVNFLGDFSVAFNRMAEQLGNTINNLTCISEEYKDLSHRDTLTGIYNRYAFFKFSEQLLQKYIRPFKPSTIFIADIDKFKEVNDTYGHLCGDEVLKAFSALLVAQLRDVDVCCRYGGEEFVVLMPDTPLDEGRKVAERLRVSVADTAIPWESHSLRITASFGLAEINRLDATDSFDNQLNAFIQLADSQLYTAKERGRNRVCG